MTTELNGTPKVWIKVHGLYADDLFEVDASNPEDEIAAGRAQFKATYPNRCVIIKVERITPPQEGEMDDMPVC